MVGQTISHYRVLEKVGSGGMGVVYRAEDLKLKRQVALKFMPEELAGNRIALERFRREAEAASALNHPSICVIHDIDEAAGRPFIAMEYVAGRTLDQLIGARGVGLSAALRYAIQMADALAKAHAAGIVHRDLKPSNIMVTGDGLVKVLDFGLAKLVETRAAADADGETRAPAGPAPTEQGAIVGTVAYMSPEQAQGLPVDPRSDIFSLGSVLHEMLTGQRAFRGESRISTLNAIVHADPTPAARAGAAVPPDIERIIARCLRKDPQRRWQTMSDLKVALEDAHEEISSGTQAGPAPAADRGWRRVLVAGVLLAVAAAAAAVAMWMDRRPPPAFELRPERFTADPRIAATPAISLDGTRVAYASDRDDEGNLDVYVQHISVGQPMRLTRDGADDYDPALSPDGSQVVFRSERDGGGLYIAETLGGAERRLVPGGRSPSFSPDGSTIAYLADRASGFPPAQPIFLVPARGGSPRPFQPGFGVMARGMRPRLSFPADGKHLAFSGWRSGSPPVLDWWIAPVDGGLPVATTAFPQYAVPRIPLLGLTGWHGPHLYFLRGSLVEGIHLFRAPLDPATWKAGGPARQLTSGGGLHFDAAIARDGTAVVAVLNVAQDFASLPIEPAQHGNLAAPLTAITSDATIKGGASVSRDGAVMAYAAFVSWETGRIEIRVRAVATGRETVYRSDNLASTANPQISPDGSLLAYTERIDGRHVSFIGPPDRLPGRQVCDDCQTLGIASDSRWALVRYAAGRLARRDLSTGAERTLLTAGTGAAVLDARLSPDDRWLALVYAAPEHSPEIYVAPVAGEPVGPERWQRIPGVRLYEESFLVGFTELVWTVRSPCPAWSADGRELYYFSDRDGHACIWAQRLDPRTKQPHGSAYPVHHLHRTETSPAVFGSFMFLAASRDRLIVPRWTVTGNLWTAKLDRP